MANAVTAITLAAALLVVTLMSTARQVRQAFQLGLEATLSEMLLKYGMSALLYAIQHLTDDHIKGTIFFLSVFLPSPEHTIPTLILTLPRIDLFGDIFAVFANVRLASFSSCALLHVKLTGCAIGCTRAVSYGLPA